MQRGSRKLFPLCVVPAARVTSNMECKLLFVYRIAKKHNIQIKIFTKKVKIFYEKKIITIFVIIIVFVFIVIFDIRE